MAAAERIAESTGPVSARRARQLDRFAAIADQGEHLLAGLCLGGEVAGLRSILVRPLDFNSRCPSAFSVAGCVRIAAINRWYTLEERHTRVEDIAAFIETAIGGIDADAEWVAEAHERLAAWRANPVMPLMLYNHASHAPSGEGIVRAS
ncbi:hypothetical protein J2T57_001718 [Natronocella acetinitrilica]|uniref:Uncharacterized protein n=1 Tax=Natronocella acetinitrilica TaxID=414046 RepID=A0AAE3KBF6_9GAMM|nr:hypothetical protein [Natronocella acetinitrilica]MCP1674616.1 hypothetical protein [Natronocella acetinitrilica]